MKGEIEAMQPSLLDSFVTDFGANFLVERKAKLEELMEDLQATQDDNVLERTRPTEARPGAEQSRPLAGLPAKVTQKDEAFHRDQMA